MHRGFLNIWHFRLNWFGNLLYISLCVSTVIIKTIMSWFRGWDYNTISAHSSFRMPTPYGQLTSLFSCSFSWFSSPKLSCFRLLLVFGFSMSTGSSDALESFKGCLCLFRPSQHRLLQKLSPLLFYLHLFRSYYVSFIITILFSLIILLLLFSFYYHIIIINVFILFSLIILLSILFSFFSFSL